MENPSANVHVTNNTNKTVKKIKISGTQAEGQSRDGQGDSFQRLGAAEGSLLLTAL